MTCRVDCRCRVCGRVHLHVTKRARAGDPLKRTRSARSSRELAASAELAAALQRVADALVVGAGAVVDGPDDGADPSPPMEPERAFTRSPTPPLNRRIGSAVPWICTTDAGRSQEDTRVPDTDAAPRNTDV